MDDEERALTRDDERGAFLATTEWAGATRLPMPADASTRSYARLMDGPRPALLMDAPPAAESAACPPDADEAARTALGYNAEARLAGSSLHAFAGLSSWLRERGVRAPQVYAMDPGAGLAVIEDMGDALLSTEVSDPAAERAHYARACEVLHTLAEAGATTGPIAEGAWHLQDYDDTAMMAEVRLLTEWYGPYAGAPFSAAAKAAHEDAWRRTLSGLGPADTLVLRDYHAENILVLSEGVGVIDYQDALVGRSAYDFASLIEDARRDVGAATARVLYEDAVARRGDSFAGDYAILAAQRNAKILGIFARLIERDAKPRYGAFVPRVRALFARDLARPQLAPVRAWAEEHMPELADG